MGEVAQQTEQGWTREGLVSWKLHENGLSVAFRIHNEQDDEVDAEGAVKWDGCVNWSTGDACEYHFCGKAGLVHFAQQMFVAVCIAEREMGSKVDECFRSSWR